MNDDRPVKQVEDVQDELESMDEKIRQLSGHLVGLGVDHENNILRDLNDIVYKLRDAITYRGRALRFQLILLHRVYNSAHHSLNEPEPNPTPPAMIVVSNQLVSVFDSIIFHSISLFDYLGNLIDFICRDKGQFRLKWNGAAKASRDPNNIVSESPVAEVVDRLDREWVSELYSHRSDVIHYKADHGGRTLTFDLAQSEVEVGVYAPTRFVNKFDELKKIDETHVMTIHYVAHWLTNKTLSSAVEIAKGLREHMNQKWDSNDAP